MTSGSAIWLEGPADIDTAELAMRARERGVLLEPGHVFFGSEKKPDNFMRAGISSIPLQKIEPGIKQLASVVDDYRAGRLAS